MNADYENQGILPQTCTCDSIKVRGKGKRSYAFSEGFSKRNKFEEFDQMNLEEFSLSVLCLRFQSCIDRRSTQLRNLEERYCLEKQIKNK